MLYPILADRFVSHHNHTPAPGSLQEPDAVFWAILSDRMIVFVAFPDAIIHFFDLSVPYKILNQPNDQENDNKHANVGKDSAH